MRCKLDRVVHEPARLRILMILLAVDKVDFKFLLSTLGMSKGNLSSHTDRLEKAGYVKILKGFNGKITHTQYHLTKKGEEALSEYWKNLDKIRSLSSKIA